MSSYDIEVAGPKAGWRKYEFSIYYDVTRELSVFRTHTYELGWLKAARKIILHKLWRKIVP